MSPELSGAHVIMSVRNGRRVLPVFVEGEIRRQRIFILYKKHRSHRRAEQKAEDIEQAFSEIAPEMIFKNSAPVTEVGTLFSTTQT